jgi:hypothetical protein
VPPGRAFDNPAAPRHRSGSSIARLAGVTTGGEPSSVANPVVSWAALARED